MTNAADILAIEKRKTWELINELVEDMSVFDVFLYANDYHNLKAAIKEVRMGDEYPGIFMEQGTVDVKLIREAVQTREFQNLPAAMRTPAEEAYKALLHTQDGQLCDIIIDKAALDAICAAGKSSGNEFLELYAELSRCGGRYKDGGAGIPYRQGQGIPGTGAGTMRQHQRCPSGSGSHRRRGFHRFIPGNHGLCRCSGRIAAFTFSF